MCLGLTRSARSELVRRTLSFSCFPFWQGIWLRRGGGGGELKNWHWSVDGEVWASAGERFVLVDLRVVFATHRGTVSAFRGGTAVVAPLGRGITNICVSQTKETPTYIS